MTAALMLSRLPVWSPHAVGLHGCPTETMRECEGWHRSVSVFRCSASPLASSCHSTDEMVSARPERATARMDTYLGCSLLVIEIVLILVTRVTDHSRSSWMRMATLIADRRSASSIRPMVFPRRFFDSVLS